MSARARDPLKFQRVAAIVRKQVTDGILAPGALAPSGAALARLTGYSVSTCRNALRALIADGILVPGLSPNARPRVPAANYDGQTLAEAKRAMSTALATRRRAAGLTQPQLARLLGVSVTMIGHAETGRTWQSRPFWELADKTLDADGELLRLHDNCRAAEVPDAAQAEDTSPGSGPVEFPVAITVAVPEQVKCITITWVGGEVTTVYPPAAHEPGRTGEVCLSTSLPMTQPKYGDKIAGSRQIQSK